MNLRVEKSMDRMLLVRIVYHPSSKGLGIASGTATDIGMSIPKKSAKKDW